MNLLAIQNTYTPTKINYFSKIAGLTFLSGRLPIAVFLMKDRNWTLLVVFNSRWRTKLMLQIIWWPHLIFCKEIQREPTHRSWKQWNWAIMGKRFQCISRKEQADDRNLTKETMEEASGCRPEGNSSVI